MIPVSYLKTNSPASCEKDTPFRQGFLLPKTIYYHSPRLSRAQSIPLPAPGTNQFQSLTTTICPTQTFSS